MIKSMTGFASVSREDEAATVSVTVRSVNHRYLDLQVRLPSLVAEREAALRGLVQARVARGRVELVVGVKGERPPAVDVSLNGPLVEALSSTLELAHERGLAAGGLTASDLLRFPQAVTVQERDPDPETRDAIGRLVTGTVETALAELDTMRRREGEFLLADLDRRCGTMRGLVDRMESAADAGRGALVERLRSRLDEIRAQLPAVEDAALAQELVKFAARSDVSEELTRLRGHLEHWTGLVAAPEPCGRKLDFLLQEMNREVNTLGAKIEGAGISELVVAAKAELEKIREQVQNVE